MHLLIDGQALQTSSSRQRGIGRYAGNFLRGLAAVRPNWRIEVVQNSALTPIANDNLHGLPALTFQPPLPPHMDHHEINDRYYADWLTAQGADGVLMPSYCEGWDAAMPSFCGPRPRLFGIVHDLIPLLYPAQYLADLEAFRWYSQRFRQLLQCDFLLSNSEATARDVRALGGAAARVVNVGGAADPLFTPLPQSELAVHAREVRKRFGLQREFLLYVGAPDYRKNLLGALQAFASLSPRYRAAFDLAVVCRMNPDERASVEAAARQAGVASALRLIGSADDADLRTLYQTGRLFFFPSLYEGLGLPVLEALHCGAPVVTSNASSLPEYAGPHSWLCDPTSPQAMAEVLQRALAEPREAHRRQRQLFARTFSWEKTAERACAVMERIVKRHSRPIKQRRRLAWVVPLTKRTRRMSEEAAELLPHLAERYEIEVIAVGSLLQVPENLSRRHLILTARELPARHAALPYDMFVYQSGPAPTPPEMLDLLQRFPGLVLQDDLPVPDALRLAAAHAARIDRAILRYEQSDGLWRGFAVRCLAGYVDEAEAILSSWAALRVRGQQHVAAPQPQFFSSGSETVAML
jgi:glycosyltransferase involved in cell wall biosynthesis